MFTGNWYNELGSQMFLNASGGQLSGFYASAVGQARYTYPLAGRYDTQPASGGGQTMAWTVSWQNAYQNAHSATGWSGQYFDQGGNEEIYTLWLLAAEVSEGDEWESTLAGQDTFTRTPPPKEAIARSKRRGNVPHPKGAHPKGRHGKAY